MHTELTLDIIGTLIDVDITYHYYPAVPAKLDGHPDNRASGEPEEWVFSSMKCGGIELVDMLAIDKIERIIIEMIKEVERR
jgi:uncharacterized membrane protein